MGVLREESSQQGAGLTTLRSLDVILKAMDRT